MTRIGCLGASITFGRGLADRRNVCYPAVLQQLLGDAVRVRNFGYSGATAGRVTNEPYWETPSFTSATRFEPQVCVLGFGTNDAQHANLSNLPRFRDDLIALIEHFRTLGDGASIVLTQPLPVFEPLAEIDIATVDNQIRPTIAEVGETLGLPVVDSFTPFRDHADWFPDNLHPTAEGARLLAELVADALRQEDLAG